MNMSDLSEVCFGNCDAMRRPVRNKRCSRRNGFDDRRPPKRLFTPEIKRYLKDWLIRRRDNPYPNRDEKKTLAVETGLTYIQVCNWFANWRRKLKNAGKEPQKKTWGHLIKTYNSQVQGNVEHFSITSEDSIWNELEQQSFSDDENPKLQQLQQQQQKQIQNEFKVQENNSKSITYRSNSFENNNSVTLSSLLECTEVNKPSMITRWLESAAKFRPSEQNYLYYYDHVGKKFNTKLLERMHAREELDAAEALTTLANAMSHF